MKAPLLIGRVLFGGFFLVSGLSHFFRVPGLSDLASAHHVPWPPVAVVLGGVLMLLGGLSVLLGYRPRLGLWLIILFLVPATLVMHGFWGVSDPQARALELTSFFKNAALVGAAFGLMAVPRPWSNAGWAKREAPRTDWLTGRRVTP